jgi:hypothetical protein
MSRLLRENWMIILVAALMVFGFVFLRTPGDDLASTAEFDARVTDGTPVLVEFYSNT